MFFAFLLLWVCVVCECGENGERRVVESTAAVIESVGPFWPLVKNDEHLLVQLISAKASKYSQAFEPHLINHIQTVLSVVFIYNVPQRCSATQAAQDPLQRPRRQQQRGSVSELPSLLSFQ